MVNEPVDTALVTAVDMLAKMVPLPETKEESFNNAKMVAFNAAGAFSETTKVVITIGGETRTYEAIVTE